LAIWDKLIHTGGTHEAKAKELWDRAIKYFDGKLYNRALQDLQEAIALNPALKAEALELMQSLSGQDNDEQAVSVGLALIKMDSKNVELMNKLGNSLRRMNQFSSASKLYTQALKINPQMVEAKYNLAACGVAVITADMDLVRQTRAVEAYTQPRRYDFQGARAGFCPLNNQMLVDEKHTHKLVKKPAQEEEPPPPPNEEEVAKQQELLLQQLRRDLEQAPDSWETEYNLGLLCDLFKRGEEAITHLRAAYQILPADRMVVNNLAVAIIEHSDNVQEAEDLLLENLKHHKFDRTTVLNLAVLNRRTGKAFQTLKYFAYLGDLLARSLGEFETEKVEAHGKELFERRKYIEAIPIFENLSREKPQDFWLDKLAVMYLNGKREDQYIATLKRVLKLNPSRDDAQKKISETALGYEKEAHERLQKGSKPIAINLLSKAVHIEETAERWAELAQLYEDIGEEIMADNAMTHWKALAPKGDGETPPVAGAQHPPDASGKPPAKAAPPRPSR